MRMAMRRGFVVGLGFIIQILFYVFIMIFFADHFPVINVVYRILGLLIVLSIIKNSRSLDVSLPWIMVILIEPILGTLLYLSLGNMLFTSRTLRRLRQSTQNAQKYYLQDPKTKEEVEDLGFSQMRYLYDHNHFPVYKNNQVTYYPLGDEGFPAIVEELKKAEKFIFIEYFIINHGEVWDTILEILKKKVKAGVEVRLMYDDIGCISMLDKHFPKEMEALGIKCVVFNHLNPLAGVIMNNRDHRKILVIDGKVAFTGGMNLADEYINVHSPYGHWKDNAIRIKGSAVWSFTLFFLTSWNAFRAEDGDFTKFKVDPVTYEEEGYIIPYCDAPLDDEDVGADVYMNILNQAQDYVYIMTPYLIIDEEMIRSLVLAAKRGVDVRLIVPGIPDKKIVYTVTQSYFKILIDNHIKIYTYTPGFVHAKVFVSDDHIATVGTINMDYRSLVHHFECGLFMRDTKEVMKVKKDCLDTLSKSHLVTEKEAQGGLFKDLLQAVLRLIAPML